MSGEFKNLETLVELASVQSAEKRSELLKGVTDLFFAKPESQNSEEAELFCGIMNKVASELGTDMGDHLAARMEQSGHTQKTQTANGSQRCDLHSGKAELSNGETEPARAFDADQLVDLLRNDKYDEFVLGFARMSDVDVSTARKILEDPSAEALAIACKANRFDHATFSTIVLLTDLAKTRQPELVDQLMQLYDQVTVQTAQRAMRFWRVRRAAENGSNGAASSPCHFDIDAEPS